MVAVWFAEDNPHLTALELPHDSGDLLVERDFPISVVGVGPLFRTA